MTTTPPSLPFWQTVPLTEPPLKWCVRTQLQRACHAACLSAYARCVQSVTLQLHSHIAHATLPPPPPSQFNRYEELLGCPDVDAVIICTPNCHHHEVLLASLDTNKHILVEKPMCTTVPHCREIATKVAKQQQGGGDAARRVFWVGMEYRYMPAISKLIAEVDNGVVGAVKMCSIREHRSVVCCQPFVQPPSSRRLHLSLPR